MAKQRKAKRGHGPKIAPFAEQTEHGDRVALTGRLQEFRSALEDEIKAAKAGAYGRGVVLLGGRKIAQAAGAYQYVFRLKDQLNLPDDLPGELRVGNAPAIEVTMVSIEGLTVIISSSADLGEYVQEATLTSDLTFLLKNLISRIEEVSVTANPVGDRILDNAYGPADVPSYTALPIEQQQTSDGALNGSQQEALESSLKRNLTYIWGPPGTGKTKAIAAIAAALRFQTRSVFMVSHMNTAVDGALIQIAKSCTDPAALFSGKIVRVGEPKDHRIKESYPDLLLQTQVNRRSEQLASRLEASKSELENAKHEVGTLRRHIELSEFITAARTDVDGLRKRVEELRELESALESARADYAALQTKLQYWRAAKQAALAAQRNLQGLEALDAQNSMAKTVLADTLDKQKHIERSLQAAQKALDETESVNWILRRWRGLPSVSDQKSRVDELLVQAASVRKTFEERRAQLDVALSLRMALADEIAKFRATYANEPDQTIQASDECENELRLLVSRGTQLRDNCRRLRRSLEGQCGQKLQLLQQLGFPADLDLVRADPPAAIELSLKSIEQHLGPIDLASCQDQFAVAVARVAQLEAEITSIENALSHIEAVVISEADVVGTTLTRSYINDVVRTRRYDTIVLDEASMAPIPAIWVAASLADRNAVIVGDPQQLPPIVLSADEKGLAHKWLGTDIFESAGVDKSHPPNFIALDEQYRMNPEIGRISNSLFYTDHQWKYHFVPDADSNITAWLNTDWQDGIPVLLVDTGPLNAWVTSVPRGKAPSRLNFLSATLCVDLCRLLLRAERAPRRLVERRILIECPYQPHAELLKVLLQEGCLNQDVEAGTVHAFQGSEADVVILDLVNDEPHWRVGMFMSDYDKNTRKLLNVAITRARRRLIVVGDFSYAEKLSRKAFLGQELIPFLRRNYTLKSAIDIAPPRLLARVAEASRLISGSDIEAADARVVVTQDDFYPQLIKDMQAAQSQIVIYSPFLTQNRIASLQPALRAATERGIRVFVVTRSLQERGKRLLPEIQYLERTLQDWEVTVIHKRKMHEKLVFVDDHVLWSGSLNPLSYSDSQEVMERRVDKTVVREYARIIRLNDLIEEFAKAPPKCPICHNEMIASEGRDDPYFWRCVVDQCYSRSIDDPRLRAGKIVCSTCQGDVEFGEWGGKPAWRCIKNRRHHQRLIRTHLRLPKMREKIPAEQLQELESLLGVPEPELFV